MIDTLRKFSREVAEVPHRDHQRSIGFGEHLLGCFNVYELAVLAEGVEELCEDLLAIG